MRSLEKITRAFKNGVKKAELERERTDLGPVFMFRIHPDGELTNSFEGIAYEKISQEIDVIPNPKGIFERISYYLGSKFSENGLYLSKD